MAEPGHGRPAAHDAPESGRTRLAFRFRDLSLSSKLLAILMAASVGALLLAGSAITAREVFTSRQVMEHELVALADVVGTNSAAPLSFRDPQAAHDVLSSLGARRDIARAALLLPDGGLFCTYERPGEPPLRAVPLRERAGGFRDGRLAVLRPVRLGRESLGTVYLECAMTELHARIRDVVVSVIVLVLGAALFAYVLSIRLRRVISEPIRRLSRAAQRVSASRDYSVRVEWSSRDELGLLTESFNRMLEQIEEQDRALRASEDRLRQAQKMEAVGRLAGGVAHDFNNLLTVINGYASLLEQSPALDGALRSGIVEIHRAGDRAAALTRQLLAFGRKQVFESRVFDLRESLGGMEQMLRRLIGEDIRLVWVPDADVPNVLADPAQIEQAVMNLVVNARDAMPGGGTITMEVSAATLDEAYAVAHPDVEPGTYARITVSDTGTGIPRELHPHIFEPFFTTKEIGKGTGLGLATVYGIVKQSHGHITFASDPGRGSTFRIYLPAAKAAPASESPVPPAAVAARAAHTILLVEDEPLVRELARKVLETQGHQVLACGDPREAIRMCESHPATIDLLLTDVVMPGMNGRDLHLRLSPGRPRMRTLFMSGYPDRAVGSADNLTTEAAFIQKPFSPAALAAKVRSMLDEVAEAA